MKQCTWCGKEYPDDATICAIDAQPLAHIGPLPPASPEPIVPASDTVPEEPVLTTHDLAARNMRVGGMWCLGGILVTVISYNAASGPAGGTYVIAWGAILFGGIRFFRGLTASGLPAQNLHARPTATNNFTYTPPELVAKPTKAGIWICSRCGEPSEPQFTMCWKCQTPRNSAPVMEKPSTEIYLNIEGLIAAGFDVTGAYLLTVSHSGRAVYSTTNWQRIARDLTAPSPDAGTCVGIGPLDGQTIPVVEMDFQEGKMDLTSPDGRTKLNCERNGINVQVSEDLN